MFEFKTRPLGYDKDEVDWQMSHFEQRIQELEKELKSEKRLILSLKEEISKYKDREIILNEALLDAKIVSKRILKDAESKAREIATGTESQMQERLGVFEQSLAQLQLTEKRLRHSAENAKTELIDVLSKYLTEISDYDFNHRLQEVMVEDMEQSQQMLQRSKVLINFPEITKKRYDDIPTYSLESLTH